MSLDPGWLRRFLEWATEFGLGAGDSFLDIGAAELICGNDPQVINQFVVHFGGVPYPPDELRRIADGGIAGDIFIRAGLKYISIDYLKFPHCMLLDLNRDSLPAEHVGRYKFVSNTGTSEHVLNQYNTFKIIHEATADNGIMYHGLPMSGMFEHGLFNYNAKFFWALAKANDYDVIRCWGWTDEKSKPVPDSFMKDIQFNLPPQARDALLHILLRRKGTAPFGGLVDPAFKPA
jgi:hypothetical protein